MTKFSTLPLKFVKHLKKHKETYYFTYLLLTALSSNACTNYEFTKSRNCWTFGLQQSAVDSAIDGERVFAPAYGPKEDILSSDNGN